ncbi:hypothetical protein AKO1_014341 [Acrasis kona]|uniref:Uncharacterized protein n=1 Tax=Acrasis kona TaxID=1008807 RepID=A0AAW2YYT9_9EUKA
MSSKFEDINQNEFERVIKGCGATLKFQDHSLIGDFRLLMLKDERNSFNRNYISEEVTQCRLPTNDSLKVRFVKFSFRPDEPLSEGTYLITIKHKLKSTLDASLRGNTVTPLAVKVVYPGPRADDGVSIITSFLVEEEYRYERIILRVIKNDDDKDKTYNKGLWWTKSNGKPIDIYFKIMVPDDLRLFTSYKLSLSLERIKMIIRQWHLSRSGAVKIEASDLWYWMKNPLKYVQKNYPRKETKSNDQREFYSIVYTYFKLEPGAYTIIINTKPELVEQSVDKPKLVIKLKTNKPIKETSTLTPSTELKTDKPIKEASPPTPSTESFDFFKSFFDYFSSKSTFLVKEDDASGKTEIPVMTLEQAQSPKTDHNISSYFKKQTEVLLKQRIEFGSLGASQDESDHQYTVSLCLAYGTTMEDDLIKGMIEECRNKLLEIHNNKSGTTEFENIYTKRQELTFLKNKAKTVGIYNEVRGMSDEYANSLSFFDKLQVGNFDWLGNGNASFVDEMKNISKKNTAQLQSIKAKQSNTDLLSKLGFTTNETHITEETNPYELPFAICCMVRPTFQGLQKWTKHLERAKSTNDIQQQQLAISRLENRISKCSKRESIIMHDFLNKIKKSIKDGNELIGNTEQVKNFKKNKTLKVIHEAQSLQNEKDPQKLGTFLNVNRMDLDQVTLNRLDARVIRLLKSLDVHAMERIALADRLMLNLKKCIQTLYKYLHLDVDEEMAKEKLDFNVNQNFQSILLQNVFSKQRISSTRKATLRKMANEMHFPTIGKITRNQLCPTLEGILLQGLLLDHEDHIWNLIVKKLESLQKTNQIFCAALNIIHFHSEHSSHDTKLRAFLCCLLKYRSDSILRTFQDVELIKNVLKFLGRIPFQVLIDEESNIVK